VASGQRCGDSLACRWLTQLDLLRAGGAAAAAGVRHRFPGTGPARGGARADGADRLRVDGLDIVDVSGAKDASR
jgi:hypothetical protein